LTEVYLALGILPEAYKTAAVLGENYPDSEWYKFSYDLMQKYNVQKP
jgi:outer membrane protein assembly factor BamD